MKQATPQQQHRREVRNQIVLPMVGVLLAMGLLTGFVIAVLNRGQFSMVADLLSIIYILVPIVLTCLVPTILLMAVAIGVWKLNSMAISPLARGRTRVVRLLARAQKQVPRAATPVIMLQERVSRLEHLLSRRQPVSPEEEQSHGK
jgi:hypothetical protein